MIIQKRKVGKYWHFSVLDDGERKYVMHHPILGWTTSDHHSNSFCFSTRIGGYFTTRRIVRDELHRRKYYEDLDGAEWL